MTTGDHPHVGWSLADWRNRLCNEPGAAGVFTDADLGGLDDQVRRHLGQAIAVGTPWAQCAQIRPACPMNEACRRCHVQILGR